MAKQAYPSAEQLTFDQVAKSHHETTYDEVARFYGGPMSKHPVISVKGHPEVIWVRPDMGVGMVANSLSFTTGASASAIPWRETKRSLKNGYLPIITNTWSKDSLLLTQESFAVLIGASEVHNGHEKQAAVVEMSLLNTAVTQSRQAELWAFVPLHLAAKGVPPFPYNTYDLFEVTGVLPEVPKNLAEPKDNILRNGSTAVGVFWADESVSTSVSANIFHFFCNLRPGEKKSVRFLVTSSSQGLSNHEVEAVRSFDYQSLLDRRMLDLEEILEAGTQIRVPDTVVNDIYRAQILHYQSQLVQAADKNYYLDAQGFQGVWPWETMKLTIHLDSIGHHDDARKCLEYYLEIQGRFPPHGNFKSSAGVFGGTIAFEESGWEKNPESNFYGQLAKINSGKEGEFPNWMNGTGAMLYAFATHYFYTRDREWLQRITPALIRASDWIISERQETKKKDAQGEKVLHYGLLPIGRAYDTAEEAIKQLASDGELPGGKMDDRHAPLDTYYPCFTDSYSSQGLSLFASALAEISHPESARLVSEAKAYHDDILEVMRRTRSTEVNLPPFPERLNRPPAWAEFATGALSYLDTGFMESRSAAFEQLENYMKVKWNKGVLGLTGGLEKNGDPHGANSYYVNFSEDIWHRGWLLRGDIEKALLGFYSMLAYGMDKDTLATVERFHLSDQRYAPFFLDTSASGRVCGLIRQALLLEENKVLHLLAGVPRRWLEHGKEIYIDKGVAIAAKLQLHVKSQVNQGKIFLNLEVTELRGEKLDRVKLRIPHPSKHPIKNVVVNGKSWDSFDPIKEVVELKPKEGRTEIVVNY